MIAFDFVNICVKGTKEKSLFFFFSVSRIISFFNWAG